LEGNFVEKKEILGCGEGNYFFGSGNTGPPDDSYTDETDCCGFLR
jgi:hypothetical protein